MKFRFCGEADCPDWVLVEINTLSRLSSVKLKVLCQLVVNGLMNPPIDIEKAEKLFAESKLDVVIDLKACIACINFIVCSTIRYNCDSNALQSELQQLGLPREHSTAIKRVVDEQSSALTDKLRSNSLRINNLGGCSGRIEDGCIILDLTIDGVNKSVTMSSQTVSVLLENLQYVRKNMAELHEVS